MKIGFVLNREPVIAECEPEDRLLDILRDRFSMTGVKEGCGEGECGACAVLVDGLLKNACVTPVAAVSGSSVVTIEGYRTTDRFEALSRAFDTEGAVQCGFCTPGFIMAAEALLSRNPKPTERETRLGISGNLCRCTGYNAIVRGILRASEEDLWG